MMTKKKRSHSELSAFRKCNRKWQHRYKNRYYPKHKPDAFILGSAFHASIASWLTFRDMDAAVHAVNESLEFETGQSLWKGDEDTKVVKLSNQLIPLIKYHLPKLDPDEKYRIISDFEMFDFSYNAGMVMHKPMVEYRFEDDIFMGYADACLIDQETNECVLVDWKLRKSVLPLENVKIDSQLPFYAGIINSMGGGITKLIQWQFRKSLPQDARMSKPKKDGDVSVLSPTKTTTINHLLETLPEEYEGGIENIKEHKNVKPESYFQDATEIPFTVKIASSVYLNQHTTAQLIEQAERMVDKGFMMPGLMSSYECGFCEYSPICSADQEGEDIYPILEEQFDVRL